MLGFVLSERTISRWMKRAPRNTDRAKRWLTFLRNHREAIAAMDFFTVPTMTRSACSTASSDYRSAASGRILSRERLGGLHHRYDRAA
jgi:hypothetical protein